MTTPAVTLFYDGLCPLCSREIAHYRRRVADGAVRFVDIAAPGFDAAAHGLVADRVHQVMHVKVGDDVRTGVDAFVALWRVVPGFGWLATVAQWPVVRPLLTVGYTLFARVRPWLPRRRANCPDGSCRV